MTIPHFLRILELRRGHVPYPSHGLKRRLVEVRRFSVDHFHDHDSWKDKENYWTLGIVLNTWWKSRGFSHLMTRYRPRVRRAISISLLDSSSTEFQLEICVSAARARLGRRTRNRTTWPGSQISWITTWNFHGPLSNHSYVSVGAEEDWIWLDISVDDSLRVKVRESFEALLANRRDLLLDDPETGRGKSLQNSSQLKITTQLKLARVCPYLEWVTISVRAPPSKNSMTTQSSSSTRNESCIWTMLGWW